jgi:tetratricopeptide (TPR) repeat protein
MDDQDSPNQDWKYTQPETVNDRASSEADRSKWPLWLTVISFFVLLLSIGTYFYMNLNKEQEPAPQTEPTLEVRRSDHYIEGVPYHGYYNHFYDAHGSSQTAAALMIAGYYGDTSVDVWSLLERQKINEGEKYTPRRFAADLEELGYIVVRGRGEPFDELRKTINPLSPEPAIVLMNLEDQNSELSYWAVVVGMSDEKEQLTLHDFYYGNDYTISYDEFLRRYVSQSMLIPRPVASNYELEEKRALLQTFDSRLLVMDTVAPVLADRADLLYQELSETEEELLGLNVIISDERTEYLHPALRMVFMLDVAIRLILLDRADEAISLLEDRVLPLNKDLDADYNGWKLNVRETFPSLTEDRFASLYVVLANAYALKGNMEKAQELYDEAITLQPDYINEIEFLNQENFYPTFTPN